MYVDDTVLFANNAGDLHKTLRNYCAQWKMNVKCQKREGTVFVKAKTNKERLYFIVMAVNVQHLTVVVFWS